MSAPKFPPEKLLVATDLSENSLTALDYAIGLARVLDAEIVLAHVIKAPMYPFDFGDESLTVIEDQIREAASSQLDQIVSSRADCGVPIRTVIRHGHVVDELERAVRTEEADLLALATHGYTGLKHMMLGSHAERALARSPCPVLVVPCDPETS